MTEQTDEQAGGYAWVPALAEAALARLIVARRTLSFSSPVSDADWVWRSERLAVLCEREAAWLDVLGRWAAQQQDGVPRVFGRAAFDAAQFRRQKAVFFRDLAEDGRRRLSGEPLCAVVGCGCGGTCGVAA
jgi:hypothetical protein